MTVNIAFDNSYARLPPRFFARVEPTPVPAPALVALNRSLALDLGLDPDALASATGVAILAGQSVAPGSEPIAMAYAGHQFGNFVPQLGDGRALLLGEVVDREGRRRDIQLKGSGPTPFSRRGDGRAALGPVLREYLVAEAFAALGIPTTRALAAVTTGDYVYREAALPGAVLTRVAASHVRVGTFQYFAARRDVEGLRLLADHVVARHYPDAAAAADPHLALLERVIAAQARLVARWLGVGFVHGVMNTDNMSIAGETIDFGPCAFIDTYDPATVFSSIDETGRYAYANQPRIAMWNLARFAETLLPLLAGTEDETLAKANEAVNGFAPVFEQAYLDVFRGKLGLAEAAPEDATLVKDLLALMARSGADFTLTFRRLADLIEPTPNSDGVRADFIDLAAFDAWAGTWRARLAQEGRAVVTVRATMNATNPAFIPRNHRVEAALAAALEHGDYGPFHELSAVLARPYDDRPEYAAYAEPPLPSDEVYRTFCGT